MVLRNAPAKPLVSETTKNNLLNKAENAYDQAKEQVKESTSSFHPIETVKDKFNSLISYGQEKLTPIDMNARLSEQLSRDTEFADDDTQF